MRRRMLETVWVSERRQEAGVRSNNERTVKKGIK